MSASLVHRLWPRAPAATCWAPVHTWRWEKGNQQGAASVLGSEVLPASWRSGGSSEITQSHIPTWSSSQGPSKPTGLQGLGAGGQQVLIYGKNERGSVE